MVRRAWCNRTHSAVTQKVNAIEEGKVNGHAACLKFVSGQLLLLGLERPGLAMRPHQALVKRLYRARRLG